MNNNIISVIKNYPNYCTIMKKYHHYLKQDNLQDNEENLLLIIPAIESVMLRHSYETHKHAMNMVEILTPFAKELELTKREIKQLKAIARLHDIGKIAINSNILKKKEPLSDEDWKEIKKHSIESYKILQCFKEFEPFAKDILYHHERFDGSGYPEGLKGEEIPYFSRILSVIDTYEVLISGRAYKKSISSEYALAEIKRCAGTQFDPKIVAAFEKTLSKPQIKQKITNEL